MSERASEWAWQQTGLAPLPRLALLAFAREADDVGKFTLRRKELAALLECSVDTVDRRIKALEAAELMRVDRDPKGGGFKASRYALAIPKSFAASRSPAASVVDISEARSRKRAASHGRKGAASIAADTRPPEAAPVAASIRDSSGKVSTEQEASPDRSEDVGTVAVGALTLTPPDGKPKRKRRVAFNPDWTLGEKGRAFAREEGFLNGSADALFDRFKDHHLANGTVMADWEAAWRKWVRNEIEWKGKPDEQQRAGARPRANDARGSGESFTDFMRRRATPSEPVDLGRLDSLPVK